MTECRIDQHDWRERKRKPGSEECAKCGDHFPCDEPDCSHLDCVAHRDVTRCHLCRKPVEGAKEACSGNTIHLDALPFVGVNLRGRVRAHHPACLEKAQDAERVEHLRQLGAGVPVPVAL